MEHHTDKRYKLRKSMNAVFFHSSRCSESSMKTMSQGTNVCICVFCTSYNRMFVCVWIYTHQLQLEINQVVITYDYIYNFVGFSLHFALKLLNRIEIVLNCKAHRSKYKRCVPPWERGTLSFTHSSRFSFWWMLAKHNIHISKFVFSLFWSSFGWIMVNVVEFCKIFNQISENHSEIPLLNESF